MTTEYEVGRPVGRCVVSGRALLPGEMFYSALFETATGFERRDYAAECWSGPPDGAFCTFRTRIAERPRRRRTLVGDDVLVNFFLRLADDDSPARWNFRFVLTLILMRKRIVKYEQTLREADMETWQVRLVRDNSLHTVKNPRLTDEQAAAVTEELKAILAGSDEDVLDGAAGDAPGA